MNGKISIRRFLSLILCVLVFVSGLPVVVSATVEGIEPILITEENYSALGLSEDYIGYYGIATYEDLVWFSNFANYENVYNKYPNTGANAVLLDDIVVNEDVLNDDGTLNESSEKLVTDIGIGGLLCPYEGTFDGNGHTVSGLYGASSLFFEVDEATIKNLSVADSYFYGDDEVEGFCYNAEDTTFISVRIQAQVEASGAYVGGFIGECTRCVFINCSFDGIVSGDRIIGGIVGCARNSYFENCVNNGRTEGHDDYVGGICGLAYNSEFKGCKNTGEVCATNMNNFYYTAGICGCARDTSFSACVNAGDIIGYHNVGGITGYLSISSSIVDCYNSGDIMGSTFSSSIGGVCGEMNDGNLLRNGNTGDITGNADVGGICGSAKGTEGYIKDCYNTGDIVSRYNQTAGGICGQVQFSATFENCYNTGYVYAGSGNPDENFAGAICGKLDPEGAKIINSYYYNNNSDKFIFSVGLYPDSKATGDTEGSATGVGMDRFASGEIAYLLKGSDGDDSPWGQNIDNGESVQLLPVHNGSPVYMVTDEDGNVGYSNSPDGIPHFGEEAPTEHTHTYENGFCTYKDCEETEEAVEITADNLSQFGLSEEYTGYYAISNGGQLTWFAETVNKGNNSVNGVLVGNISLNSKVLEDGNPVDLGLGLREWTPIGNEANKYSGHFDGRGYTVKGLYINSVALDGAGLFGYGENTTIENVILDDSCITANRYVGGICGQLHFGKISECESKNIVVYGSCDIGGICGQILCGGEIVNCKNSGRVKAGYMNAGGICGYTLPDYEIDCDGTASVKGCINIGIVESLRNAGGICGEINSGSVVEDCINNCEITGLEQVGGIVGYAHSSYLNNCTNNGDIKASQYTGGICGMEYGGNDGYQVLYCVNTGNITSYFGCGGGICGEIKVCVYVNYCYNTGDIFAERYGGGIAGAGETSALYNCFTTGKVDGEFQVGAVSGDYIGTIDECYYISGSARTRSDMVQNGVGGGSGNSYQGDGVGETIGVTAEDFASGKVAYLLNGKTSKGELVWGQDIDNGNPRQAHPVFSDAIVYCGLDGNKIIYTNTYSEDFATQSIAPLLNDEGYYEIYNAYQLGWFRDLVNGDLADYEQNLSANAILMDDIYLNLKVLDDDGTLVDDTSILSVWTPIADASASPYSGTFDGNGHTVRGLYISGNVSEGSLFGYVDGGTVKNLTLNQAYVKTASKVAGICISLKNGAICNCRVEGIVSAVSSNAAYAGGICDYSEGAIISDCTVNATVSAKGVSSVYAGGICRNAGASVKNCSVSGEVYAYGTRNNIYSGGIAGVVPTGGSIEKCINSAEVSAVNGCDTTDYAHGSCYAGGICSTSDEAQIKENINNGSVLAKITPPSGTSLFVSFCVAGGICGQGTDTVVSSCENNGRVYSNFYLYDIGDLNLSHTKSGGICGMLSGETSSVSDCVNTGKVELLSSAANGCAGGIVGAANKAAVSDVRNEGFVFAISSNYTASAGGIVGALDYAGVYRAYNVGNVQGQAISTIVYLGGIVGNSYKCTDIENCGNIGSISLSSEKSGSYLGGILGQSTTEVNITNCFNAGKVSCIDGNVSAISASYKAPNYTNSYYLINNTLINKAIVTEKNNDKEGRKEGKGLDAFNSGEVAYLLQSGNNEPVWGQDANNYNSYPILTADEAYAVINVGGLGVYSVSQAGDVNCDKKIDINDYQEIVNLVTSADPGQSETYEYDEIIKYDLNGDGYIDALDAALMNQVIMGKKAIKVYAVGDFDFNGYPFEVDDIVAMREGISNPEALSTAEKKACDLNGDGKIDRLDLMLLEEKYDIPDCEDCAENTRTIYTWSNGFTICTATLKCTYCGKTQISEKVKATVVYSKEPTCTSDGTGTFTATFKDERFESQTRSETILALGHNYEDITYTWAEDYSTCTGNTVCARCGGGKINSTVETVYSVVSGECGGEGVARYTATFASSVLGEKFIEVEEASINHVYSTATYTWSDDCSTCIATANCVNCHDHQVTETVDTTVNVIRKAKCTTTGYVRYTATFTSSYFETKMKYVTTPKADHDSDNIVYSWASDFSTCTAQATCSGCGLVAEEETVYTECEVVSESNCCTEGWGIFTATFTNGKFETQVTEGETPKSAHQNYSGAIYEWNSDYTICTGTAYCDDCGEEITELALVSYEYDMAIAEFEMPYFDMQFEYGDIPVYVTYEEVYSEVERQLMAGETDIIVYLQTDADPELIKAIRRAICDNETVEDGSINLTIAGPASIPVNCYMDDDGYYVYGNAFGEGEVEDRYGSTILEQVTELRSISLPSTTCIGAEAFLSCTNLESLYAPKVKTVGNLAFANTALTEIDLPEATSVGARAFAYGDVEITYVNLPKATTLGIELFSDFSGEENNFGYGATVILSGPGATFEWNQLSESSVVDVPGIFPEAMTDRINLVLHSDKEYQTVIYESGDGEWYVEYSYGSEGWYYFMSISFVD